MSANASATKEDPFYVGFALSVYQNSGDGDAPSNWGDWEQQKTLLGRPTIAGGDKCGRACEFWDRYDGDIGRAAALGSNSFRLSLEWARLQPDGPGSAFDPAAVQRYHQMLDSLEARGMEPFMTLHHFVHPMWFERLGGFFCKDSITLFVDFATAAFQEFGHRVRFWATFNEINVHCFASCVYGSFPPGKIAQLPACGRQMLNMLRSHTAAYAAIKALPGGGKANVGLVHNWFTFEAQQGLCCTPFYMHWVSELSNRMWGNDIVLKYLQTGVFDWNPTWGLGRVYYKEPNGRPGCDHFGLNYYSRGIFNCLLQPSCNPGEVMTDMPYAVWADGLTLALGAINRALPDMPIYITETGCADVGDSVRPLMIESYMHKVEEALGAGIPLRGLLYWTLDDDFEWALGFGMKFGMFTWSKDSQERKMRPSGALLHRWFARLVERAPALRVAAAQKQQANGTAVGGVPIAKE